MKTKHTTLRTPAIGSILAMVMAVSAQRSAADDNQPIWAGHFKDAYSTTSLQEGTSTFRPNSSSVKNRLIWAGHFEQAYSGSVQGSGVVRRPDPGKYLLWAGYFKETYGQEREASEGIDVAMDQE